MARRSPDQIARTRAFWLANRPGESAAPAYTAEAPPWWQVTLALVVALLLQTSAARPVFRGGSVSFVTLLVAWYGVRHGTLAGLCFGLIAGTCEDALAGTTEAAWTFATGLVGVAAGRLARTWLADTRTILVPGAALVTLLRDGAFTAVLALEGRPLALGALHSHAALWGAALNALVTFLFLRFGPDLRRVVAYRR